MKVIMSTEPASFAPIPSGNQIPGSEKKLVAGLLGILLTCLGVHKFYLGYTKEGLIMLLVSLLTCGFAAPVMGVIGLIEGIIYLTKTDEEFVATYITNKKGWF
jgi:TM2 domain-containing membrane protein YozV